MRIRTGCGFRSAARRLGIQAVKPRGNHRKWDHFCVGVAGYDPATVTAGLKELGAEIIPAADEAQDRGRFR